jgi:glycosyltransferase involved in cell wall biosynthesis
MARQFLLIDHSIEDSAGHYLEYARRVLGAAKAQGFRTVLAVNRRAQNLECPEADVILKAFSRTFWENQAQSKFRTLLGFLLNNPAMAVQTVQAAEFADELALLIGQASITEGDFVFIPTLGGIELIGISQYSAANAAVPVSWHLLFRRDLSPPTTWLDVQNKIVKWRAKASFALASATFLKGVRYLYTDTEELTCRYENLGVGKFKTLPIPIDEQLGFKRPWQQGPLVVSYLGDLRAEKGIHLLPQIIESLRQDGFDASRVVFRIQGNMPNGVGNRTSLRVKAELSNGYLDGVEVLDGPLNSATYRDLLLGSDVVLLPYSPTSYAARSSGIFAEALAAGIPTIHPSASWMGQNAVRVSIDGYVGADQIADELKKVLQDYQRYETASLEYSKRWRMTHSAKRLTQVLIHSVHVQ